MANDTDSLETQICLNAEMMLVTLMWLKCNQRYKWTRTNTGVFGVAAGCFMMLFTSFTVLR